MRMSIRTAAWLAGLVAVVSAVFTTATAATHTVRPGDTLSEIADRYDVSVKAIADLNRIKDPRALQVGDRLVIPGTKSPPATPSSSGKAGTYMVRKGDTLSSIAARHGVSVTALKAANGLRDADEIAAGATLKIPPRGPGQAPPPAAPAAASGAVPRHALPADVKKRLDAIKVSRGKWKYVVIHHSATRQGNARSMDQYHRRRRMENGLAYHFVIDNGLGGPDGRIEIGSRWPRQLNGGHVASEAMNAQAIGICMVGNYDEHSPTASQMKSLYALVQYLRARCGLPASAIKVHREINTRPTRCPGARFPIDALRRNI
jgi:LysM repeat protein